MDCERAHDGAARVLSAVRRISVRTVLMLVFSTSRSGAASLASVRITRSLKEFVLHRLRYLDRQETCGAIAVVFSALVYDSEVSASFGILVGYKPIELAEFE